MKAFLKIHLILITTIAFAILPKALKADGYTTVLPENMDREYVAERAVLMINGYHDLLEREVTISDVDLSRAYKIYVGTNIFELPTSRYDEIVAYLEEETYIFLVPVTIGDHTFTANIATVSPVRDEVRHLFASEEALAEYESRVGTWGVSAAFAYSNEEFCDYYETAARVSGRTDVQPILIGALPGYSMAVALYPDADGNAGEIAVINPKAASWDALKLSQSEYENKTITYATAKESSSRIRRASNPDTAGGFGGGNPLANEYLAGGLLVSIVVAISVVSFVVRKSKGKAGQDEASSS